MNIVHFFARISTDEHYFKNAPIKCEWAPACRSPYYNTVPDDVTVPSGYNKLIIALESPNTAVMVWFVSPLKAEGKLKAVARVTSKRRMTEEEVSIENLPYLPIYDESKNNYQHFIHRFGWAANQFVQLPEQTHLTLDYLHGLIRPRIKQLPICSLSRVIQTSLLNELNSVVSIYPNLANLPQYDQIAIQEDFDYELGLYHYQFENAVYLLPDQLELKEDQSDENKDQSDEDFLLDNDDASTTVTISDLSSSSTVVVAANSLMSIRSH